MSGFTDRIKTRYSDEEYPWPSGKEPWSVLRGGTGIGRERSGSLQPEPPLVISIQDSPPCVSIDLSEEPEVTPTLVDILDVVSDSEFVSPSIMSGTSLDPISDQSLSTSPVSSHASRRMAM